MSKIDPQLPRLLIPVAIPKPWGQEIWYTGMETRGVSKVRTGATQMPLDEYLQTNPKALCDDTQVLLLKILDPAPRQVTGDLYFEVHEEKQEVYVVTAVDTEAWPDGHGAIRLGMRQDKRQQYADDDAFRQGFLQAVQRYEVVRRRIDEGKAVAQDHEQELALREEMENFTDIRQLQVGDVVKVPVWTPHALQHGVRVVEFQTATYERFIISFAQQVLTQDHWDSSHAIKHMQLGPPATADFSQLQPGIERIVEFADFNVWRCSAAAGSFQLPQQIPYAVCMAIGDGTRIGELQLQAEQACFVPHAALQAGIDVETRTQLLIAAPGL